MRLINMKIVYLMLHALVFGTVHSYTLDEVTRLKKMLFTNYDKGIRPIFNQSNPIEVYMRMYIQSITKFDLGNGQLDTVGYTIASWYDERMMWYDTEFSEIESIGLEGDEIWHPNIAQFNAMADEVTLNSILLYSDGLVIRIVIRKFYTFCNLNMRFYPNDKHDCSFHFVSIRNTKEQLLLMPEGDGISDVYLTRHGEWDITDSAAFTADTIKEDVVFQTQQLVFTFKLARQPSFNVLHRSVPLGIVAFCVMFIHIVPLNSGERISYAVTLFLSIIFWQALVAEDLPKNSAQISIFSFSVTSFLFLTGATTISSVVLCRMASTENHSREMPAWLQSIALRRRPKKKSKPNFFSQLSISSIIYEKSKGVYDASRSVSPNPKDDAVYINRDIPDLNTEPVESPNPVTWMEAAIAIDVLLLYIHIALFVLSSLTVVLIFALT